MQRLESQGQRSPSSAYWPDTPSAESPGKRITFIWRQVTAPLHWQASSGNTMANLTLRSRVLYDIFGKGLWPSYPLCYYRASTEEKDQRSYKERIIGFSLAYMKGFQYKLMFPKSEPTT